MSLDNAFRVTANGQFVQDVNLAPGTYTLNCCVNSPNSNYYCRLYNGTDIVDLSTPITPGKWNLAVITFTLTKTMTKFDIARNASTLYPVLVGRPMFENGNNASTARPSELDLLEEIESVDTKYGEKVIELSGRLTQTNQSLETEYTKKTEMSSYVDGVKQTVQNDYNTKFTQTAEQIGAKASQSSVSELGTRVGDAESGITQQAALIGTKVSQSEFNALGTRVSGAESSITQQAQQIASKVAKADFDEFGNAVNSNISEITQKADGIEVSVDDLKDGLDATGIKINIGEITVTADKFKIKKTDGTPVAVFSDNILLDDYGNLRIKSLSTPFVLKTGWSGIDFKDTPNVILTGFSGSGELTLPSGQQYNGLHINILWDMFFNTDIWGTRTLYKLKPSGSGVIFSENGLQSSYVKLSTQNRVFLGLTAYWANDTLNWIVTDRVNRNVKPEIIKAGDVVYSAKVSGSTITVLENKLPIGTLTASVSSNVVQVTYPSFTVLNDSGTQVVRTLNSDYLKVVPQLDDYNQATVMNDNTAYARFELKRVNRANIASTSATAQVPYFTFNLVAIRDFSAFYETI